MRKVMNKNEKGITLIALVITIIVLLLLAGVAISMLSGENGIINKTTEATYKTEVEEIKEALGLKITELLAINLGKEQEYSLTLDDLNISRELKTLYENKLKISKDGELCYDSTVVTNVDEQNKFKELGIEEYQENNTDNFYTFTLSEIMTKGYDKSNVTRALSIEEFWPEGKSEDFKNNVFDVEWIEGAYCASNVTCEGFTNPFAPGGDKDYTKDWTVSVIKFGEEIWIAVYTDTSISSSKYLNEYNYIEKGFENLQITIGLPE